MKSNIIDSEVIKSKREELGLTQEFVANAIGVSQKSYSMYESGERNPKIDKILKLSEVLKINLPFSTNVQKGNIVHAPDGRFPKKITSGDAIPFYDVDFAAGDIEFFNGHNTIQAAYTMDIPEFSGCTAFRTYGDSMEKLIKSGDILFGTKIEDWKSHLEYGQIYGIICTDKRRYLKYIRKAREKEESHFLLKIKPK